jgi:hypothetical protein
LNGSLLDLDASLSVIPAEAGVHVAPPPPCLRKWILRSDVEPRLRGDDEGGGDDGKRRRNVGIETADRTFEQPFADGSL